MRGEDAAEHPVDVGSPHGRAALDDREAVGDEDERGQAGAELLGGAECGPVQAHLLSLAGDDRHLGLDGRAALAPAQAYPRGRVPEPHEPRLRACPRREPLGTDVQRLEQVGLPGAVRADDEHEAGLEPEVERGVRAEAPERRLRDDQPASLIGMIRYRKSSLSPWMRPGRSGLMSFRRTVSSVTDSRPSRRNSALKPISSGSPL